MGLVECVARAAWDNEAGDDREVEAAGEHCESLCLCVFIFFYSFIVYFIPPAFFI